jgi:hypothetical protein
LEQDQVASQRTERDKLVRTQASQAEESMAAVAHYRAFVQWERWKANGRFGAKRTVVSVMPNGVEQRSRAEATSVSIVDVKSVG